MLYFKTLQSIPLASAVVLGYLSPIFTMLFGIWLAHEPVNWRRWVAVGISFGGVILANGIDDRVPLLYLLAGLAAAVFSGLAYNMIRKIKETEHPLVIITYFPLVTLPICALYCIFVEWVTPTPTELALLVGIGLLTQGGQYYMTRSIQLQPLSEVIVFRYLSIGNALFFGWFFFDESYTLLVLFGMFLTIAGVLLSIKWKAPEKAK